MGTRLEVADGRAGKADGKGTYDVVSCWVVGRQVPVPIVWAVSVHLTAELVERERKEGLSPYIIVLLMAKLTLPFRPSERTIETNHILGNNR